VSFRKKKEKPDFKLLFSLSPARLGERAGSFLSDLPGTFNFKEVIFCGGYVKFFNFYILTYLPETCQGRAVRKMWIKTGLF